MNTTNRRKPRRLALALALVGGAAGIAGMSRPALAGDNHDHYAPDRRIDDCGERFREGYRRVWVEPVYRTVCEKVWVPAEYRTEVQRVWREPVVQDVPQQVWVPDQWGVQQYEERGWDGRRIVRKRRVLLERGHYATVMQRVVTPAHWEDCPRQVCVHEGFFKNVERQELVTAGHWDEVPVGRYDERHAERGGVDIGFDINLHR